ncbi:LacI family DNA-binding transcriptional regulator [Agromyces sp. Leaf222]|uniref:LacI family DNA-binding transcriptional regulator n=1 Tax=Agromyces sp. Leaf222 TaxID=1735688 RepID=UPI0006F776DA|nr:LacI family DNA-binding transcriptional regulator [Agromyces sp. Leaf222]KQM82107.1 transcriptional regulator [Agromyces sp. Leaf222]
MSESARPTLSDVAARAGVSASTASLAFSGSGPVSDSTKQRVLAAAAELGYAGPDPRARSLRRGRSGIVGVVLEQRVRTAFLDPVKIQMLDGITEGIAPLGAGLLLLTDVGAVDLPVVEAGGPVATPALSVENAPVDAVVLIGCSPRLGQTVAALRRRGIPTVAIEGAAGSDIPEISIDNRDATRRGAQHLRDLGHADAVIVTLPLDPARTRGPLTAALEAGSTSDTASERLRGAREVFPHATGRSAAASSIEEGLEAGRILLADPETRPTAIIAQSDLLAAGVLQAAEELGVAVPGEVSVVGFDGIRVDGLQHDLTTLVQPSVAKGRAAGEAVVRMLADDDGDAPASRCFTSVLHVGDTTAPPRAR